MCKYQFTFCCERIMPREAVFSQLKSWFKEFWSCLLSAFYRQLFLFSNVINASRCFFPDVISSVNQRSWSPKYFENFRQYCVFKTRCGKRIMWVTDFQWCSLYENINIFSEEMIRLIQLMWFAALFTTLQQLPGSHHHQMERRAQRYNSCNSWERFRSNRIMVSRTNLICHALWFLMIVWWIWSLVKSIHKLERVCRIATQAFMYAQTILNTNPAIRIQNIWRRRGPPGAQIKSTCAAGASEGDNTLFLSMWCTYAIFPKRFKSISIL